MKFLTGVVLGISSAIALQTTALAQVSSQSPSGVEGVSPVQTSSESLVIESRSIDTSSQATSAPAPAVIYDANRLKTVSDSLRAKPNSGPSLLNSIPTDLIHTPSSSSADNSAIDFFQVPPPDPSLGININTN